MKHRYELEIETEKSISFVDAEHDRTGFEGLMFRAEIVKNTERNLKMQIKSSRDGIVWSFIQNLV